MSVRHGHPPRDPQSADLSHNRTRVLVRARGIAPRPPTFRSRCGWPSPPSPSTGCGAHDTTASPPRGACHRPRGRGGRSRPGRRVREGGRPPAWAVALDARSSPSPQSSLDSSRAVRCRPLERPAPTGIAPADADRSPGRRAGRVRRRWRIRGWRRAGGRGSPEHREAPSRRPPRALGLEHGAADLHRPGARLAHGPEPRAQLNSHRPSAALPQRCAAVITSASR